MLDKEYEPKPVYNRLLNLIQKEWKTNLEAQTNEKGQVSFRGFCGAYVITVKMPDGRAGQWEAVIKKGCENQRVFTVN